MSAPSSSHYNALYLKLQRRFSSGVSFLTSYSYGKSIDNGSGIRTTDGDTLTPSNAYDLGLETGLSAFDFRQRWTTSWLWDLPFGSNRRFLNHGGVVDAVLGGWQLGGIFTMQSGFPFTVCAVPATSRTAAALVTPTRPGSIGSCPASERSRTRYFNAAAFVDRTNPGGPFRYGTVPRNSLIGPGIISLDASANKRFSLGGSKLIEARIGSSTFRTGRSGISPETSSEHPTSGSSRAPGSTRGKFRSERSCCSE